jgi:hypothetical protein
MRILASLFVFALLLVASAASAQIEIRTERVSSNDVQTSQPLVVRVAVFANATTAPQSATIRIRWNATYLNYVGVSNIPNAPAFTAGGVTYGTTQSDGDMGAPVVSPLGSDSHPTLPNYVDVSLIGPPVFPATLQNPILCYAKFEVTAAGNSSTYQVTASVRDGTTNHLPYILLSPAGVHSLDGAGDSNLSFTPANITSVSEWMTLAD